MTPAEVIGKMVEAFNANDREAFLACYSPDVAVDEGQGTEGAYGPALVFDSLKAALPDARFEAKYLIEQGDICAGEMFLTGTHTGAALQIPPGNAIEGEIPATGKSVRAPYGGFARVVDDLIVSDNTYGIVPALVQQLGVTTNTPAAVEKMYDAFNTGDKAAYMATAHPDVVMDEGLDSERRGETAWAADWETLHTAFPDIRCEIVEAHTIGDRSALRAVVTGTHTGPLTFPAGASLPEVVPTGKAIHLDVSMFYRLKDGLVVSEYSYGWMAPMLIQLGAVTTAAPKATA